MVRAFVAGVDNVSRLFGIVAGVLIAAAMIIVCQMIFMRYVFRAPTIWQTDFVVFSATAAIFLGAPYVLLRKGHVGVDVIETLASAPVRRALAILGAFLGLAFCTAMFVASAVYFHEAWEGGWTTATVWAPPLWIPLIPLPVGFGLLTLQYVAEILKLFTSTSAAQRLPHAAGADA
jgi:TRAP-type C4-dicarboxylate transport system, small permease component